MNYIFMAAIIPLIALGLTNLNASYVRAFVNFAIALLCLASLILIRSKVPLHLIPIIPVTFFGAYHLYLVYTGALNLWAAIGILAFPLIIIFLCQMTLGLIESVIVLIVMVLFMFTPIAPFTPPPEVSIRFVLINIFILSLTIIYERISVLKDRKETVLKAELSSERDMIQTMKDNIEQGIFLMDSEHKILPQYSKPLLSIFSYYDSDLAGKNFLDILSSSLDAKQLQTMKNYFTMVFSKSKNAKTLESANPIYEFEFKTDEKIKTLSSKFTLIEQANKEPVIIGIIQDISMEKEFKKELQAQRESQETEMKNMFDVIQIDPMVFQDFVEDMEANFNYINSVLKDRTLTEKQVVTKLFQNVHAIKSNALTLGLGNFGKKLHTLEDDVKLVSGRDEITVDDILGLAIKLETVMQEKDYYKFIITKIEAFRSSNQIDSVFLHSMNKAVEKTSEETQKKVNLQPGEVDLSILESKLRKPIKDILFQCIRNSIFHGIEPVDERIRKKKKPHGLLEFSVTNVEGNAVVTFSDDGGGLDWEKIKTKYLTLHPEAVKVNRKVLLSSIFSPEFSTSDETSMVAGRGVGLSLVRDLVKENNGTIKVDSTDAGLTFKFIFPMAS
jgi:two-component system chemotaxis sensor kinase CheA